MDEAMKKLLAEMSAGVKALNETVTAKFSSADPAAAAKEKDELAKKVLDLEHSINDIKRAKAIRKMAWAIPGKELAEGVEGKTFKNFMDAVRKGDMEFLNAMEKAANGQSEGTNADGGFAVPTEYANEIIKLERIFGVARRIARIFPMGTLTRKIPSQLTNPTVTWTSEATNHTKTKITLQQITQTAKKLSALVPLTEELLSDNNVNLDAFLFQVVAEAVAREEDRVAFAGHATGGSDAFDGILYASGVNVATTAGATLDWKDIVGMIMTLKTPYRRSGRARFVLSTSALQKVMQLRDDQNRPIWAAPQTIGSIEGNVPGTIFGYPYEETDQIPTNLGSGSQTAIEFGPFGDYLWLSDRGTYEVKASDSASDANGGAGSAFLQDEIWYKFRRREAITVAQPEAFAYMLV